jgi:predicted peptidase
MAAAVPQNAKPVDLKQEKQAFEKKITITVGLEYLLYLPEDYATSRKRYPLVLFLHGSGERGSKVEIVANHGPCKEVKNGRKFPFILVSPQCPEDTWWDSRVLTALLDTLEKKYRIDKNKEYLTGLSMGGYGTYDLASKTPKRFAAIAPICGAGNPSIAPKLRDIPIWATHGTRDGAVPFDEDKKLIDAIIAAGNKQVKFTAVKDGEHDVWTDVYKGTEIYDWLLSHSLKDKRK